MKELIVAVGLSFLAFAANACTINSVSTQQVDKVLKQKGGLNFTKYAELCEKLNEADAGIEVHGTATVLQGKSIAWSVVFLTDNKSGFAVGNASYSSTLTNDFAGMDKAEELLYTGVIESLNAWPVDEAIKVLENHRIRLKAQAATVSNKDSI